MNKFMVVAHGISRLGGIEEVSRQVVKCLGGHVEVVVLEVGKTIPSRLRALILMNIWLLRNRSIAVMHSAILERYIPKFILNLTNSKMFVWAHGIEVWGRYGKKKTSKLPYATKVIAVSRFTRTQLLVNYPNLPVVVINNSIDPNLYNVHVPRQPSKLFEILTVGRLSLLEDYKGHKLVIDAVALLQRKDIFIHYNIVGTGDALTTLVDYTESKGVSTLVEFHGYVDDLQISEIYARSKLFVMPSFVVQRVDDEWSGEGFGLVYLEAAVHGLASIACREGGQVDAVIDGITGSLVSPSSTEIADTIEYFYRNPTVLERTGVSARAHSLENHNQKVFKAHLVREML